jgi:hypothetical protein
MGILDNRHLIIAEQFQEPAALVFVLIMTFYLTNVVLDIAWVRFRWRYFMMASKFAGMIGALYFACGLTCFACSASASRFSMALLIHVCTSGRYSATHPPRQRSGSSP